MENDTVCPERDNDGEPCGGAIPPGAPVDLCRGHLIRAYLFVQEELADATNNSVARVFDTRDDRQNVVYYVRLGNRIKIGTTRDLQTRMVNVSHEEILAIEPGGYETERLRHEQFHRLRVAGEWFIADTSLLRLTEGLRVQHAALQVSA